jgi:glycerol-3-phosphate O-acyltransferase
VNCLTQTVTLPFWLFALMLALVIFGALQWMLLPSMRWYFRRKVRGVIDEISVRLNIDIPQFKLTRRQGLIDQLMLDPRVLAAVDEHIAEHKVPRSVAMQKVNRYAREIVPAFNAYIYFRFGYWLSKNFARFVYRVRLGYTDSEAIAKIHPKSTVVFVMNHRSNMDYVLVSFLTAERVALSYAVGEWARIWPLQGLIRAMGAYFVRRNSGDPLYRMVLQRYVQMATEGGVPQALYPEGGLTIDGNLRTPKLGLFDYMLKNFNPAAERDVVFIPVGLNYDRVMEDRTLLRKLNDNAPRGSLLRTVRISLSYLSGQLMLTVLGRRYRYGYACVNFGRPMSMREYVKTKAIDFRAMDEAARRIAVAQVGEILMQRIGEIIPVLPVPLVATVLLRNPQRAFSELELKAEVLDLILAIEATGAHVYVPRADRDYALTVGLRMLTLRHLVEEQDGFFRANLHELALLKYYANSIAHIGGSIKPSSVY